MNEGVTKIIITCPKCAHDIDEINVEVACPRRQKPIRKQIKRRRRII